MYLDIGEGITYQVPPTYDKLVPTLNLPSFSDIRVEEYYLNSTLDLGSLAAMMAGDRRFGPRSRAGMGEAILQYESLQAKLVALASSNQAHKFSLKVTEAGMSSIPEGAAGKIQRSILSEVGQLQVYYVKVLEKGDGYEVSFFDLECSVGCFFLRFSERRNRCGRSRWKYCVSVNFFFLLYVYQLLSFDRLSKKAYQTSRKQRKILLLSKKRKGKKLAKLG